MTTSIETPKALTGVGLGTGSQAPAAASGGLPSRAGSEKQTAKKAIELLCSLDPSFRSPSKHERAAIAAAFAMRQRVVYGAAFDLVKSPREVNWIDPVSIADLLDEIVLYEVNSTNKHKTREDFSGYFFDLTTAELLVAQSLGSQYRVAFVSIFTSTWIDLSLSEVFANARKIYPKLAVLF